MNFLKKLKIGGKLILGFAIMIILVGIVGWVGYFSTGSIQKGVNEIAGVRLPSLNYLLQADRDLQQLLVAERSVIFSNAKSEIFKELVEEYETNLKQAQERLAKYAALTTTDKEKALVAEHLKRREEWLALSRQVIEGRKADTREGRRIALDLSLGQAREKFEQMRDSLDKLQEINNAMAAAASQEARQTYDRTALTMLLLTVAGVLVGMILAFFIGRGITGPLKRAIAGLSQSSEMVASASGQVASASQLLAEGSSEQAASLEETSSSLEEMAAMTRSNADNTNQAEGLMKEASGIVESVNTDLTQMAESMGRISESGQEIGKIVKSIDEIAFQTNLLALNAAVEAARAGEAGQGFAVVADEVRALALRAAEAAKNTQTLIEDTVSRISEGSGLVDKTRESFKSNTEISVKIESLIKEISAASGEQAEGIEQVNQAVTEMDKVTQQNAASAEESASASGEMSSQAGAMKEMVEQLTSMVRRSGNGHTGATGPEIRSRKKKAPGLKTWNKPEKAEPGSGQARLVGPDDHLNYSEDDLENF
jgi:methyl-accepting chemotaxis protein